MDGKDDRDIHDRHAVPASPAASTAARSAIMSDSDNKPKVKTTQAQRDAHFQENGVRADGTVPQQKESADGEGKESE